MIAPPDDFVSELKSSAHLRFEWRPNKYQADRAERLQKLRQVIESSIVRARGWDFPHVERTDGFEASARYIGSWNEHLNQKEYWRLYRSYQFVSLARLRESVIGASAWYNNSWQMRVFSPFGENDPDTQFVDFVNTIWSIAERIDFAHRLTKATEVPSCLLVLSLRNVKGVHLLAEPNRPLSGAYISASPDIEYSRAVEAAGLISDWKGIAASCAVTIVEKFGFLDVSVEVVRSVVDQLYDR